MLNSDMMESKQKKIMLQNIDYNNFLKVLNYLYTDKFEVNKVS